MTEQRNDAVRECPFCGAAMAHCTDKDGEFWMHPGVVTDDDCFMSGQGVFPRQLTAWNARALSPSPAPSPLEGVREALRRIERVANRFDNGKIPLVATDLRASLQVILAALSAEAGSGEVLGRFGHHPEAAIDYECEIDALIGMAYDRLTGMQEHADLEDRIRKAMEFRVLSTPGELRWLSKQFNGTREIYAVIPECIEKIANSAAAIAEAGKPAGEEAVARCYSLTGNPATRENDLAHWVREAMRFIDLCDADAAGFDDLHETAERLTVFGYSLFGANATFDEWCLADLEHRKLVAFVDAHPAPSDNQKMRDRWADVAPLVDQITAEEGASVTFTGPNPDFNDLPNEVVSVCNHATGWVPEYFRADTLADCLRAALAAKGMEE